MINLKKKNNKKVTVYCFLWRPIENSRSYLIIQQGSSTLTLFFTTYTIFDSHVLTYRCSQLCSSSSASGSWVFLAFRMNSQAQWSGVFSQSMPYRCRDRRAAHACIQGAHGQKIGAEPCCSGNGCTGLICLKSWYTLTHIQCVASGTGRPHCRLWPHPSTGLQLRDPDQSLQGVREGAGGSNERCVVIRGLIILLLTFAPDIILCWHKTQALCCRVSLHSWEKKHRTEEVFHISVEKWKEVKVSKTQGKWK